MPIAASLRSSRRWPALDGAYSGPFSRGSNSSSVQPRVEVQREPAERGPLLDRVAEHPDPAAALDPAGLQAELGGRADQRLLQAAYMRDDVHRARQLQDRVADQLARAVPGDLAAAVHVDDRGAVQRALAVGGAPARRVDRRVLQEQAGVGDLVREPGRVHPALLVPRLLVLDGVAPNPRRTNRSSLTASASLGSCRRAWVPRRTVRQARERAHATVRPARECPAVSPALNPHTIG